MVFDVEAIVDCILTEPTLVIVPNVLTPPLDTQLPTPSYVHVRYVPEYPEKLVIADDTVTPLLFVKVQAYGLLSTIVAF